MGYKLTLSSSAAAQGVSYQIVLPLDQSSTTGATTDFETLRLPLSAFKPTFRGQPAPDAPPFGADPDNPPSYVEALKFLRPRFNERQFLLTFGGPQATTARVERLRVVAHAQLALFRDGPKLGV